MEVTFHEDVDEFVFEALRGFRVRIHHTESWMSDLVIVGTVQQDSGSDTDLEAYLIGFPIDEDGDCPDWDRYLSTGEEDPAVVYGMVDDIVALEFLP